MPALVLGPLLRYAAETEATVWVETDAPCEVEVLGHRARTFTVEGHHYGLVCIDGLEPGTSTPYEVRLDGERAWPPAGDDLPAPTVTTFDPDHDDVDVFFGSCRVGHPHHEPYCLTRDASPEGYEIDALLALGQRMLRDPAEDWPDLLLLLGDQVYADVVSPQTARFIRERRDTSVAPGEQIADYEEYARLYRESWTPPVIRWLLSTVSTSMIFDDHDLHDDWNISATWVAQMQAQPWWQRRAVAGFMSYWVYQHLGNLSPRQLAEDETFQAVLRAGDGTAILREHAGRATVEPSVARWSFHRDIGRTRVVVVDSRGGRVLDPGRRAMVDDREWEWIAEQVTGDFDHLLIGTSLPYTLPEALHHVEAASERICDGAWGRTAARLGERVRQALDLEHWAAFGTSFERLARLLEEVATGRRGTPPATVVVLSGDVHHAYLAEIGFPPGTGARTPVFQAVCSPLRNPLDHWARRMIHVGMSRPMTLACRTLARLAGVPDLPIRWRIENGPWFDNQIASIEIRGRRATLRLEVARPGDPDHADRRLEHVFSRELSPSSA